MSALAQGVGLFPLPEVESPGPTFSHSRRVQQRTRRAAAETDLANGAVRALNSMFCSLSSTNSLTGNQSSNSNSNSTATLRAVAHVQSCSRRFVSRLAPSFQDSRLSDDALLPQDTRDLFTAAYAFHSDALPLSAENVALPEEPGSVDLLDILPPALARRYATPTPDLFRPAGDVKPAPACRLVKSDEDYFLIIKRMLGLGMVAFTQDPKVVNGLFGTPKSDGKLRLVFDGRRVNSVFADSPEVKLPTPDLLSKLEAEPGKTLFVAKSDLDNFYHRIRMPAWMHPYFALPPVRAADLGLSAQFGPDAVIYPCCTTLPMGWSHSVYVAQAGHEHLINTLTLLKPSDCITRYSDYRLDRPRHLVYIDDLCLVGPEECRVELDSLLDQYTQVMTAKRLPPKPSKTVRPSADGVECIGVEVHGRDLTAGVHPEKLEILVRRTRAFLIRGKCTGLDLSRLIGHWSWAFMVRRCAFSVFRAVYRFIETAGHKTFDIWPSVAKELKVAMGLAPLLFTSLGAGWFPQVVAFDACPSGQGVVASECAPDSMYSPVCHFASHR